MDDSARQLLLTFSKIEEFLAQIAFWSPPPEYRIVGPNGDREYLYREGDHILWVIVEWLSGESGLDIIVYADSANQWDSPHSHEVISEEKRQEILCRFGKYLTKSKARFEFR